MICAGRVRYKVGHTSYKVMKDVIKCMTMSRCTFFSF